MRRKLVITVVAVIALALVLGGMGWFQSRKQKGPVFRTVQVSRGDLVATISATGTVEPEKVVDVGAQVAGMILTFGKDKKGKTIDYDSDVDTGTVLARIDDSLYKAAVESAKAQLQQDMANEVSAKATVAQDKANLVNAQANWSRAQKLGPSEALSQSAYDQYQANYEVAKANLDQAMAAVEQARAATAQAKANLHTAQLNLGYCTIKSPVKGVIVDRQVNIGETVVSSLSAPSLFLIATDLKRIQVWASVNEADVGGISRGQPVDFTVDAFPNRVFHGRVDRVRLNATMSQNVVTYTVVVETDNSDGTLLPYLTANVQFAVNHRKDVLLVPNAALQWRPRPDQIAKETGQKHHNHRGPGRGSEAEATGGTEKIPEAIIWAEQGRFVRPVHVHAGLTDGVFTEVEGKDITEGLRVVVGEAEHETAAGSERSPLMPQPIWRGGQQNQGTPGTTPRPAPGP